MAIQFPVERFADIRTPFYYYDTDILRQTLDAINTEIKKHDNYFVHYAVKANANLKVLKVINEVGFGIDCVSVQRLFRNRRFTSALPQVKKPVCGISE